MNTGTLINFLGWSCLTVMWLEANRVFLCAIAQAINEYNEQIREKALDEYSEREEDPPLKSIKELGERLKKLVESKDESEDESEDENEDK